ncbi:MAG: hypothetical protein IKZ13_09415 [Akkermansia sp.]|nr:hypothetical protein [Akkermansia sp.]
MNTTPFRWLVALVCLLLAAPAMAQSPDLINEDRDLVRVMRHPDGSRSVYKRQAGWRGMRCATYTASGKLAAINDYTEGKYGQLVACVIYNDKKQPIYKVSYGYDAQARLIEERMFSNPGNKLVQRVIYRYDANGNRAKPLIISLNNSSTGITPTITDDVTNAHRDLRGRRRR